MTTLATAPAPSEVLPDGLPASLVEALAAGRVVPYLGPRVLALAKKEVQLIPTGVYSGHHIRIDAASRCFR